MRGQGDTYSRVPKVTAAQLADALECLAGQHRWLRSTGLQREGTARHMGYRTYYVCEQCGSEKYKTCDIYGRYLYAPTIKYSDAFLRARDEAGSMREGYTHKEHYRSELIKRERAAAKNAGKTIPTVIGAGGKRRTARGKGAA